MSEEISVPQLSTRRQILRRGFAGTVLLFVAGGAAWVFGPARGRKRRPGLRVFDEREASILSAVAAAVLRVEPGAPSAEDVGVAGKVDELLALSSAEVQDEFRRLLRLFESGFSGILTGTGWTSFTAASARSRDERLRAWECSRIALFRTGYQAMKRLCAACYYSSPHAWASIGYPGPPEIAS